MNPYSGQWTTTLGGSTPGTVKFSAISESAGMSALQAMGGHLCGAPTTYYHGDYTDQGGTGGSTQTGTMTACIVTAGHLVGRWNGSGVSGDFDVTLNSAQTGFDGSFNDDAGDMFTYSGTFSSHFPGDGCCTTGGGGGGGAQSPITFVPPAKGWGLPTAATTLTAGLGAAVVSPPLAKGQNSASATVTGTGVGNTEAELASLLERGRIARCIGFALVVATPEKTTKTVTEKLPSGLVRMVQRQVEDTHEQVATTFFLALILCVDTLKQTQAGHHAAADASAASSCPVGVASVSVKELDLKRIRYAPTGRGRTPGLTTTCTRSSSGFTIQLHSHGKDLRSLLGSRLLLGLYQPTGTATAQVTFAKGGSASSGLPDLTGLWRNRQDPPTAPPWHLTASSGLQTLDATWTGGPGHTGLRGSFHGSLTKVSGANVYQGTFHVTEAGNTVNGTASFTIDNANQIEINLQASGGQPQHYVFVRVSS